MSETVHYKGKAIEIKPTKTRTLENIAIKIADERGVDMNNEYYNMNYKDQPAKYLAEELYDDYAFINNKLYKINYEEVDLYDDIALANTNDDGSINFELKYYNGGAGFTEVLEEAFNKIK